MRVVQLILQVAKSTAYLALVSGALISLSSCSDDDEEDAKFRAINLSPDISAIDVFEDDNILFEAVGYPDSTGYQTLSAETHQIRVNQSNSFTIFSDRSKSFNEGDDYTLFFFGLGEDTDTVIQLDDNSSPDSGRSKLRFVQGAPSVKSVDIYITAPNDSLQETVPTLTNKSFKNISMYSDSQEGDYRIRVTEKDKFDVIADSGTFQLYSQDIYTIVLLDKAGGGLPVNIAFYLDSE